MLSVQGAEDCGIKSEVIPVSQDAQLGRVGRWRTRRGGKFSAPSGFSVQGKLAVMAELSKFQDLS